MIKLAAHILLFVCCLKSSSSYAQVYPPNLMWNGCGFDYNAYVSPAEITCADTAYRLVFEDNFEGTTLDTEKWGTAYPWGRSLHSKFSGTGWERQYYKDENVYVADGLLHLHTKVDPGYRSPFPPTTGEIFFNYTSGMVFSKAQFNKGKFEARCKIPAINGLWPAFWLYGFCAQEIDIFEFTNESQDSDAAVDAGNIIMTNHKQYDCYDNERGHCGFGNTRHTKKDLSKDFHIYSVEWDDFKIIWKLDGEISREVYKLWVVSAPPPEGPLFAYAYPIKSCGDLKNASPYSIFPTFPSAEHSMHVILNTAVLLERASEPGALPQEFLIDYVKVYELLEKTTAADSSNTKMTFEVFPNPNNGNFTVNFTPVNAEIIDVQLFNTTGKNVEFHHEISAGSIKIVVHNGEKGIYFLSVHAKDEIFTTKVIVE